MGKGDTLLNAAIGAVVTIVLSFTGFSPLIGGGVAGYLQQESRKRGATVGAIAGLFAFVPFVFLVFFAFWFFVAGQFAIGGFGMGMGLPGAPELLIIFLILFPFLVVWNVGLGAVGGYLGVILREELRGSNG